MAHSPYLAPTLCAAYKSLPSTLQVSLKRFSVTNQHLCACVGDFYIKAERDGVYLGRVLSLILQHNGNLQRNIA